ASRPDPTGRSTLALNDLRAESGWCDARKAASRHGLSLLGDRVELFVFPVLAPSTTGWPRLRQTGFHGVFARADSRRVWTSRRHWARRTRASRSAPILALRSVSTADVVAFRRRLLALFWVAGFMKRFAVACVLLGCVLPAPYARAGGPAMLIGVAEDSVRQPTLAEAKVEMDLLVQAGFNAVRVTQIWAPGETKPGAADQRILRNVVQAARCRRTAATTRSRSARRTRRPRS